MQSEKKIFDFFDNSLISIDIISNYVKRFNAFFHAHRFDNTPTAINYVLGLLKCPKGEANMERMEEEIDQSEYRAYQQFITNSNWDCEGLFKSIAQESSELLATQAIKNQLSTGYILDESGHLKKGIESVGVARQYAGVAGKVDNCQVGVYASLVNEKYATIINQRLFLTQTWTDDVERCEKAGIPQEYRSYKTKQNLALDMLEQDIARGVKFDWIGGDGFYGHGKELSQKIDDMKLFFVFDVHKDETVYEEEPIIEVPKKQKVKGRAPKNLKANKTAVRLDNIITKIPENEWKTEQIRDTTKGKLILKVYKKEVWSWDGKESTARKRTLIITKSTGKAQKIKYSLSNGELNQYNHQQYAYFIAQRYWVERTFDNAKNELGMSDYQTRKWKSWHHHHSLLMLASLFIMKQQIENQKEVPLLSFRDARILIILQVFGTQKEVEQRLVQMENRHKKRQYDIDFNIKKKSDNQLIKT